MLNFQFYFSITSRIHILYKVQVSIQKVACIDEITKCFPILSDKMLSCLVLSGGIKDLSVFIITFYVGLVKLLL